MTIAIALKVGDCVVLGADSASSLMDGKGELLNVYFNAEKIVDLRKDLRIGLVTYGLGGIADGPSRHMRRICGESSLPLATRYPSTRMRIPSRKSQSGSSAISSTISTRPSGLESPRTLTETT